MDDAGSRERDPLLGGSQTLLSTRVGLRAGRWHLRHPFVWLSGLVFALCFAFVVASQVLLEDVKEGTWGEQEWSRWRVMGREGSCEEEEIV